MKVVYHNDDYPSIFILDPIARGPVSAVSPDAPQDGITPKPYQE
jgi:hypothetical protein